MAPPFLTGSVTYHQDVGVVDVNTIIAEIQTLALAAVPAWTQPVGGTIVSPPDGSGRKMQLVFSRIAAGTMQVVMTDGSGRSLTRQANIAVAGTTVNYYIGQFHMVLDWLNSGTPEGLFAIMLDESPESQTSHSMWLVGGGSRTAAGAIDNTWLFGEYWAIRNGNVFAAFFNGLWCPLYNANINGNSNGAIVRTVGGSNIWWPLICGGDNGGGANIFNIYGKMYQCLSTKDTYNLPDSEISVPVDQSTSVIFRVLNINSWAPGGIGYHDRMAVRKT